MMIELILAWSTAFLFALLAGICALIAWRSGAIIQMLAHIKSFVANKQMDAIIIGLLGALTFVGSSIAALIHNPSNWHPQAFGIGFGSLASGLGVLFKLRQQHGENDDT
ncbi:MAG: hypothetical protein ACYCOU_14830 [Sulfobacillus sp.]